MKFNNIILIFLLLTISLNSIYAMSYCWDTIACSEKEIEAGTIINTNYAQDEDIKEEMCVIRGLNVDAISYFEIEIIQGQFEGGERRMSIYVDPTFVNNTSDKIFFTLSKATSPTYVLCHEIAPSNGNTQNPMRIATRRYWSATYDQQWFKQNAGMTDYANYSTMKFWNDNLTYNYDLIGDKNNLNTTNNFADTNITRVYTNYPANLSNPFILGLGYLLLAFGIFLSFSFVLAMFRR